jgi:hypothetical protein
VELILSSCVHTRDCNIDRSLSSVRRQISFELGENTLSDNYILDMFPLSCHSVSKHLRHPKRRLLTKIMQMLYKDGSMFRSKTAYLHLVIGTVRNFTFNGERDRTNSTRKIYFPAGFLSKQQITTKWAKHNHDHNYESV